MCMGAAEMSPITVPTIFSIGKTSLAQDLLVRKSPGSFDHPKSVVVVMDGLKDPSIDLLEWVLQSFGSDGFCKITLLGVSPWLNIPRKYCVISLKNWLIILFDSNQLLNQVNLEHNNLFIWQTFSTCFARWTKDYVQD